MNMKVCVIYGIYNNTDKQIFTVMSDSVAADKLVKRLSSISSDFWKFYFSEYKLDDLDDFLFHLP